MEYKVGDYVFTDEATAEKAKKEQATIAYIKNRSDFSKPENAKKILATIRNNNMFETPVGLDFVEKLERFINTGTTAETPARKTDNAPDRKESPVQTKEKAKDGEEELDSTPTLFTAEEEEMLREEVIRRTKHLKDSAEERVLRFKQAYKIKARNLGIVIVALVFVIIGLLVLTFLSDSSPLYDAEKAVLDKYSGWEEELKEKENYLNNWEKELKEREEKLNDSEKNTGNK